jgi:glycosyltransferase involved in cell wall biosynthesis
VRVAAQRTGTQSQVTRRSEPKKGARKIVHLTSVHPAFDVRIFHKECKSIARAGYDVTLIAAHDRDETVDGVRMKAMAPPSGRISRMLRTTWAICRQAIREDADLYHFHDPELIPVALVMRIRGKRVVYDVHEDVPADILSKQYIPRRFRRPIAWLAGLVEMKSSRYFSAVVAATNPISRRFRFRAASTVVVSNYPVPDQDRDDRHESWSRRSGSAVVYAGLLSEDRCIREIVEAMSLLPPSLGATLNLAGGFSPPAYALEVTASQGWQKVNALGVVGRADLSLLLNGARAGLCIYRPDPNCVEAAPNKLFEYMQAGIPVIASDFPGFHAIVNGVGCGLLVNPLDSRSIARAIEYVLTHPEEAEQMGRRGREAVNRTFNWASEEDKLLALYAALLDSTPAA